MCTGLEVILWRRRTIMVLSQKISDLTEAQAARLMAEIIRSKQRYAPDSRGTIGIGNQEEIHSLLHMRRRILPGKKQR